MRRVALLFFSVIACHAASSPVASAAAEAKAATAPPDAAALFSEALDLERSGNDLGAKAKLDAALRLAPSFALASLERADVLLALGHAGDAVLDARRAAKALPHNPRAQEVLGQTLEDAGDLDGALAAYRQSVALRDDPKIRRRIAAIDTRQGRLALAAREWEALRDERPGDVSAHLELSALYQKLDRPASAKLEFQTLVALAPKNALFRQQFAKFLDAQGEWREARREWARAEALSPSIKPSRKLRPLLPSRR